MEERKVTVVEFDEAVKVALKKLDEEKIFEGLSRVMLRVVGTIFVEKMGFTLFGEDKEKTITELDFAKAVNSVTVDVFNDEEVEGVLKFTVPVVGWSLSNSISEILFRESEDK